jgi:hypothetical protein
MSLRDEECNLFKKWQSERKFKSFAKDGAGKSFENEKVKLIFIAKETNKTNNTWDWREYLDNGIVFKSNQIDKKTGKKEHSEGGKFNNNIYRWAKYLLEGYNSFKEYEETGSENDRKKITSKIAFMNLKKESAGSKTKDKELQEAVKRDKEFIKRQLDLYLNNDDIKILFLCGNGLYTPIATDILKDELKNSKEIWNNGEGKNRRFVKKVNDKLFVVKFYHFSYFGIKNRKYYELIQQVKNAIDENI